MCEFCDVNKKHYGENNNVYYTGPIALDEYGRARIYKFQNTFVIDFESEDDATHFRINFCPICGQKLD